MLYTFIMNGWMLRVRAHLIFPGSRPTSRHVHRATYNCCPMLWTLLRQLRASLPGDFIARIIFKCFFFYIKLNIEFTVYWDKTEKEREAQPLLARLVWKWLLWKIEGKNRNVGLDQEGAAACVCAANTNTLNNCSFKWGHTFLCSSNM